MTRADANGPTEPAVECEQLYTTGRMPNVVTATDGTVLATWGDQRLRVRHSEDGGETWSAPTDIGDGIHGGGTVVDETTGDILAFTHPDHPPTDGETAPRTVYRSTDHGRSWTPEEATFRADENGNVPALHMAEHGITLHDGPHAGRLVRPARVYGTPGYNTAIYSDDGGETWHASAPFPVRGTGEGAIVELSSGELYYSSRKDSFDNGESRRHGRLYAYSDDGGETWHDPKYDDTIPDGPRYRGPETRGANYDGHFGMLGGLARVPADGADLLLYSNADEPGHERRQMTVWVSFDGGTSWPVKRRVYDGYSAYSSLAAGRPGTASAGWCYLQFECGEPPDTDDRDATIEYGGSMVARFTLAWLLEGERTGDGEVPDAVVP